MRNLLKALEEISGAGIVASLRLDWLYDDSGYVPVLAFVRFEKILNLAEAAVVLFLVFAHVFFQRVFVLGERGDRPVEGGDI